MRGREAVRVEHTRSVGDQVAAGVPGPARLIADRSTGVAMVVADHESPAVGEHRAEILLPPEHRAADAHDEEDRRVGRDAERLRTELDAVRLDHALCQLRPSSPARHDPYTWLRDAPSLGKRVRPSRVLR